MSILHERIVKAKQQIQPYIRETPLEHSLVLSKASGCNVYLKHETQQFTGSFKARGAFNKILSLSDAQKEQGLVIASTGNHGAAIAYALHQLNLYGKIFVPKNASQAKIDNILQYGIPLEFIENGYLAVEHSAKEYAKDQNMIYVSPYNDINVIAGQGTIGLEIVHQLDDISAVLVPVGGGGLIAGIAGYLKESSPKTKIYGVLPENSPVMAESIAQGKIIEMETHPSLSDATEGGIEKDSITFELCQSLVDDYFLVSEHEIKNALYRFIKDQHQLIEGAAALSVATLFKHAKQWQNKNIVLILSGGNISIETLKQVLNQ